MIVPATVSQGTGTLLNPSPVDYVLVGIYFATVVGIGFAARKSISSSLDFQLSGRSMPAWVTGLAFISANLGALQVIGGMANGAQYGLAAVHYYWIGAIPAMVFLGVVMMPFYYQSGVRSLPEFLRRRFNKTTQRVQALLYAVASVLIAGISLYLLALVLNAFLGWSIPVAIIVGGLVVLAYMTLGGLSAAIYTEVMQFFVIVAALIPITVVGLHRVGGWSGLVNRIEASPGGAARLSAWPAENLTGIGNSVLSVVGIVFGLGFVISFGYWTTNFAEVQRSMAAKDLSAARRTPLIGAFPKLLLPLIVVVPGMISTVLVPQLGGSGSVTYNDALPLLMNELLPNGMLGIGIVALLATVMAGMAAQLSSFNTVFTYDIWQDWVQPGRSDQYYLRIGRIVTVLGTLAAIGAAFLAAGYDNIVDYIQTLFSFFNAPLFATFILGLFWKRMTPQAGWSGLVAGASAAFLVDRLSAVGVLELAGQGSAFVGAGAALIIDMLVSVVVSFSTEPKAEADLVGLVWSRRSTQMRTQGAARLDVKWYRSPVVLGTGLIVLTIALYFVVR